MLAALLTLRQWSYGSDCCAVARCLVGLEGCDTADGVMAWHMLRARP
jgi:hypothetical protein